jgi:hypothetical protein
VKKPKEDDSAKQVKGAPVCAYCKARLPAPARVPQANDLCAWAVLTILHAPGCEWIRTRAHSRPAKGGIR